MEATQSALNNDCEEKLTPTPVFYKLAQLPPLIQQFTRNQYINDMYDKVYRNYWCGVKPGVGDEIPETPYEMEEADAISF